MKNRTKRITFLLTAVLALVMTATSLTAAPLVFSDVKATDWHYPYVSYAADKGLMNGVGGNRFDPNGTTTRAMIVTIIYRLEGEPAASGSGFSDVAPGKWYSNAVIWAKANNIVNGVDSKHFAPNNAITREQMAAILYRYAGFKSYDTAAEGDLSAFSDKNKIRSYAVTALSWANGAGLISGYNDQTVKPQNNATRAEAAAIFKRFMENVVNGGAGLFADFYASPTDVTVGETTTVRFFLQPAADANLGDDPLIELKNGEGLTIAAMHDDGVSGDEIANDGIFTAEVEFNEPEQKSVNYHAVWKNVGSGVFTIHFLEELSEEELTAGSDVMAELFAIAADYPATGDSAKDAALLKASRAEALAYLASCLDDETITDYYTEGGDIVYVMPGNLTYAFPAECLVPRDDAAAAASLRSADEGESVSYRALADSGAAPTSKIAVLNAFEYEFGQTGYHGIADPIEDTSLPYEPADEFTNSEVTVDLLKNLGQYHLIYICSHGKVNGIYTGESTGLGEELLYPDERQAGRVIVAPTPSGKTTFYVVTDAFFRNYYHGADKFDDSLIHLGSCHGAEGNALPQSLINGGAKAVVGYDNAVGSIYEHDMCETIVETMCDTKEDGSFYTLKEAVAAAKKTVGASDANNKNAKIKICKGGSFTLVPQRDYAFFGSAKRLADGSVQLTPLHTWRSGAIWFPRTISAENGFTVTFSYWAGGGRDMRLGGADGLTCCFADRYGIGSQGQSLGFPSGCTGVEFDSYHNGHDPAGRHISVIQNSVSNHLATYATDQVDDSAWHSVKITYADGALSVDLDRETILSDVSVTLPDRIYLGFTAATGDGQNEHRVRGFEVTTN
ncbi:MAG: S-layer homology domain-containing protein [Bacillota bacterium]|jgi:hypothetical protein